MVKTALQISQELDKLHNQFNQCETVEGADLVGKAIVSKRKELHSALDKEKDTCQSA